MSIFGDPIGECDRCGAGDLKLYRYKGQDVCASCRQTMKDEDNTASIKEGYRRLHKLIEHANENYP